MKKDAAQKSVRSLFVNTFLIGITFAMIVSCSSGKDKNEQSATETNKKVEETLKRQPEVNEKGFISYQTAFELLKKYPVFLKDVKVNGKKKYFLTDHGPSETEPYFIFKIAYLEEKGYVPIVFYKMDVTSKKVERKQDGSETWEQIK